MKRTIPLLIATTTGLVMILSHFIPSTTTWGEETTTWFNILAGVALVLGGGNLLKIHLRQISDQAPGWGFSAVTVATFVITLVVGLLKVGVHPAEQYPEYPWSGEYVQDGSAFWWTYEYLLNPITSTVFSMLAFYVASAAFRAFRAKNLEAVLLLVTAVIVLLGRTYAGVALTDWLPGPESGFDLSWLRFNRLTEFVMGVFNMAGTRAITIGIALGIVATSLKVLLGMDRPYVGSDSE